MTEPNIIPPAEGICPLCWGESDTEGACKTCIAYYNRHQQEGQP